MKKLFTLSILFVLTSIFITSCKSSSIMKRRYNKGYYVHHSNKPAEPKTKVSDQKLKEPIMVSSALPKQQEQPVALTQTKENKHVAPARITASAEHAKVNRAKTSDNTVKSKNTLSVMPSVYSAKQTFQSVKELKTKFASGDSGDDALSLLWIIIVILLIFYLLGFAFDEYGVGSLIHLLAVIILVLLILWLLRIL